MDVWCEPVGTCGIVPILYAVVHLTVLVECREALAITQMFHKSASVEAWSMCISNHSKLTVDVQSLWHMCHMPGWSITSTLSGSGPCMTLTQAMGLSV